MKENTLNSSSNEDYKIIVAPFKPETDNTLLASLYECSYALGDYVGQTNLKHEKFTYKLVALNNDVKHIILFGKIGAKIDVFNELCRFNPAELDLFCKTVFEKFPEVKKVGFRKQFTQYSNGNYASLDVETHEDIYIDLPDDFEVFRTSLGKNIRQNLSKSINRTNRDYPSFRTEFYVKDQITEAMLQKALDFNDQRMNDKGKVTDQDPREENWLRLILRDYGQVCCTYIDDKMTSVTLSTIVGKQLYFHVIAHDPEYNYYRLGQINLYYVLERFIGEGGKRFHFLWGEYDYKYRFNGEKHELYTYTVLKNENSAKIENAKIKVSALVAKIKRVTPLKLYKFVLKKLKK